MYRKRTIATLLIALFLISTLAVAVNAELYDAEQEIGKGTVELIDTIKHGGTYSAKLTLPAPNDVDDEVRVKFDYDSTLNSLNTISFYALLTESFPSVDGLYSPYISMSIDRDGEGNADAWLVHEPHPKISGYNTFELVAFGDGSFVAVAHAITGGPFEDWVVSPEDAMPLKELKDLPAEVTDYPEKTWGQCTVLEVKVGIG
ncbi:unnamed protein product, partial [marine sediment metagenome]